MIIKTLLLNNFRNYNMLSINFDQNINILYGDNAQGKTNILEAIYISGTTKSHKNSKDNEIIQFGKTESHIRLEFEKTGVSRRIDMHLKKQKSKGIAIDGIPIHKSSELIGLINLVFFSPEDLSIIKNGPSERRRFIDIELCQLDALYLHSLMKYNKILVQRNNLLKQIGFNQQLLDTLNIWDIQLLEYGKKIITRREEFLNELNEIIYHLHSKLSGQKEKLQIKYQPNVAAEEFEQKLGSYREKDIILKTTSIGPHRDDIIFVINENDIRKYGSQGQQRTAALSLKLAEIDLVKKVMKDKPVLLLDDVLSELDRSRQNYLLNSISDIQTIVTCTGLEELIDSRLQINNIYKVTEGTIHLEKN